MATIGSLLIRLGLDSKRFTGGLDKSAARLKKFGSNVRGVGTKLTAGLTLPLIGIGVAAIKTSIDFNEAMANVATLIPGNIDRVNSLKNSVSDLSVEVGKSVEDLSGGLFQVISAFGDTADTVELLTIATRASVAGLSSTKEAVDLLSVVTAGYGDRSAAAALKVSDLAFTTNRLGRTTFPELAASMGRVVAISTELGVTQEELFGVFATGTSIAKASEVATQFRGVLQALLAPTADLTKLLERQGVVSGKTLLKNLGLKNTLQLIAEEARRSNIPITKFIGSIEGATLALALTGNQSDEFAAKLAAMKNVVGATDAAFLEQTEGINKLGQQMKLLGSGVAEVGRDIGQILSPFIERANLALISAVSLWKRLDEQTRLAAVGVGLALAAFGPLLVVLGLGITLISPWALLAVAILAVGLAGLAIANEWETLGPQLKRVWLSLFNDMRKQFSDLNNSVVLLGGTIRDSLQTLIGKETWTTIKDNWDVGLLALVAVSTLRIGVISGLFKGLGVLLKSAAIIGAIAIIAKAWDRDFETMKTDLDSFVEFARRRLTLTLPEIIAVSGHAFGNLAGVLMGLTKTTETAGGTFTFDAAGLDDMKASLPGLTTQTKDLGLALEKMAGGFTMIKEKSSGVATAVKADLELLGTILKDQIANMAEFQALAEVAVAAMGKAVENSFIDMATRSIDAVDTLKNSVIDLLVAMDREVVSQSIVPSMVNAVVMQFDRLNTEALPLVRTAMAAMETEFVELEPAIGTFTEEWARMIQVVKETKSFKVLNDLLEQVRGIVAGGEKQVIAFTKALDNLPKTIDRLLTQTVVATQQSLSIMDILFKNFKFSAETVFTDIRNAAVFTWGTIQSQFVTSLAGMIQGVNTFKEFMTQFWNTILQAAINTILTIAVQWALAQFVQQDGIKKTTAAQIAADGVRLASTTTTELARVGIMEATNKLMIGAAATTIATMTTVGLAAVAVMTVVFTAIAAIFTAIAAGLTASIYGAPFAIPFATAATVIEGVGATAAAAAAIGIEAAGAGALAVLGGLAGPVPALAHGGIVTAPTLAVLGEGGSSEVVLPLDKLDQFVGRGEQTIILEMDGRRLAERVVPHLPRTVRMKLGAAM